MTYKLDTDPIPRRACAKCGAVMQDFGHASCATCSYGKDFSASSAKAREIVTAKGARKRETGAVLRERSGSARRLQSVETIRSVMLP